MEYKVQDSGDRTEAALSGKLTFDDMKIFRQMIEEMSKTSANKWIVDCTRLEYIDSAGLGLLLRVKAMSEKSGGNAVLRVPADGKVRAMLDISRFDQLFTYET